MNSLTIIGNVTKEVTLSASSTGTSVCRFTVAVNGRKKQDGTQDTDFFSVTSFRNTAENCAKYLHKGSKVAVTGSVSCHTYQANDGSTRASLDVTANNVEFCDRRGDAYEAPQTPEAPMPVDVGDDLPF